MSLDNFVGESIHEQRGQMLMYADPIINSKMCTEKKTIIIIYV